MLKRLSAIPILIFIVLIAPLQAFAQQPPQPAVPPQGYYGPGLGIICGAMVTAGTFGGVPTDDAMHDCHFSRHLFSRPLFLRTWVSSLGAAVADMG